MASSYYGIFANKLQDGTITSVQCRDATGMGNDVPIDVYRQRGIQPPAESLPDQHQYKPSNEKINHLVAAAVPAVVFTAELVTELADALALVVESQSWPIRGNG